MNLSDKFLVAFVIGWNLLIVFFWMMSLYGWAYLWIAIEGSVGIGEFISYRLTGRTLTQKFRAWAGRHRWQALGLVGLMGLTWILLLLHLVVK